MKRIIGFLLPLAVISLLFSSCVTALLIGSAVKSEKDNRSGFAEWTFDASLSEAQTSQILFLERYPKTYNGIDISEAYTYKGKSFSKGNINVPAGVTELTFDYLFIRQGGNTTYYYTVRDCGIRYNFEGGKKYVVGVEREEKTKGTFTKWAEYSYYARIYEYYPEFEGDTISSAEYKKMEKALPDNLIVSIHIFDTDNLSRSE